MDYLHRTFQLYLWGSVILVFYRTLQWDAWRLPQQIVRVPLSLYSCQHLLSFVFLMIAILKGVRWNLQIFFFREEGFVWVNSWKSVVYHGREGVQTGWWDGQLHCLCSQDAEGGTNADSHQISQSLPCFFLSLGTQPTLMVTPSLLNHLWKHPHQYNQNCIS